MILYDATVIGGGPAGITASLYLARSGCNVLLCEKLTAGGQLLQTEKLENYPGFPDGIKGYELADVLAKHLQNLKIDKNNNSVIKISKNNDNFLLDISGTEVLSRIIIVCSGAQHKKLLIDREEELVGRGVSYCALCDGNFYRGQDVAVVGGGNAALEESLYLSKIVNKVHLIHRRDSFRALKIYQDRILENTDKIIIHTDSVITKLCGENGLSGVEIKNLKTDNMEHLGVTGLFIYVGFSPNTSFLPSDVELDKQGFIITDCEMRTNVPGIFAAGDIRSKLCRQAITAAGDGATAAQSAFLFLEQNYAR